MTLTCQECGHKISTNARYCPHCGARKHLIAVQAQLRVIILFILLTIAAVVASKTPELHNLLFSNWVKTDAFFLPEATLEILYSQNYKVYNDRIAVSGQVKNITDKTLTNVEVIVNWFDKSGIFLQSDIGLITTDPLYSNRVGSFEIISIYDERMADYQLAFRTSGGDIAVINKK